MQTDPRKTRKGQAPSHLREASLNKADGLRVDPCGSDTAAQQIDADWAPRNEAADWLLQRHTGGSLLLLKNCALTHSGHAQQEGRS